MALTGKVETQVEIKAQADKFYKIFRSQTHQIPEIASDHVHKTEVHEGDWETLGSVKYWNYSLGGNNLNLKETLEKVDEENKSITYNVTEGDLLKLYKSFKATVQVTPKDGGSIVKFTFDYEKLNENIPPPTAYLEFATNVCKDIESHLLKA